MTQSAPTTACDRQILCCYVNHTSLLQITRISNIPNWYFERTVFPGQRLLFTAPLEAELEIHTSKLVNATLSDKILCTHLQVHEGSGEII
jgi:hypothetical protein